MWIITLIVFLLILTLIVLVHEFGHFYFAKKFGTFIYEFSIGMGPLIFSKRGKKDTIKYNLRAFPIGGYVSIAGEVYDDDKSIPKDRLLCHKPIWQRIIVMAAGVFNNFVLAIIIFFIMGCIWGSRDLTPRVDSVMEGYPMSEAGIVKGDVIKSINHKQITSWDEAQILLYYKSDKSYYDFEIEHTNGKVESYKITPKTEIGDNGSEKQIFGVNINQQETHGLWSKITYSFNQFWVTVKTLWLTLIGLFTGKISLNALSGPVGVYQVVGDSMKSGLYSVVYLIAYLSINVGIINILPFPAFDGGRILFLLIEKIKGSPVNSKFENLCHTIGFILILLLIVLVTIQDVIKLF